MPRRSPAKTPTAPEAPEPVRDTPPPPLPPAEALADAHAAALDSLRNR